MSDEQKAPNKTYYVKLNNGRMWTVKASSYEVGRSGEVTFITTFWREGGMFAPGIPPRHEPLLTLAHGHWTQIETA